MNDCLVTKLKASVNNENLLPLNGIVINVVSAVETTGRSIRMYGTVGDKRPARVLSGTTYFTDSAGTANYGTEYEYTINNNGFVDIYVSNGAGSFVVFGKYETRQFLSYTTDIFTVKGESLSYLGAKASSENLNIDGINIVGDVSALKNEKPYLSLVCIDGSYGDVTGIKLKLNTNKPGQFLSSDLYGQLTILPESAGAINLNGSKVTILPSEFAASNCINLYAQNNTALSGTISQFANATANAYDFRGTATIGTAEALFEAILAKQTAAGTYKQVTLNTSLNSTFHGSVNGNAIVATFAANSITVKINNVTKGTYNGSTWSYS